MARNIIAVLAGIVVGGFVNMALITLGPLVIPPPPGVDMTTAEGIAAGVHLLEPRNFLMPFLAHAIGTLVGAFVAYLIASGNKPRMAFAVGVFFLLGGIAASTMIPAPTWFIVLDLVVAYLPMAWLATRIGRNVQRV
ncbi:MAG TPA: hypothetical protein VKZ41_11130 [Gemmatimonadales bacterium]|nr:hypothetical protein [Gemmatimonadales bacterium]